MVEEVAVIAVIAVIVEVVDGTETYFKPFNLKGAGGPYIYPPSHRQEHTPTRGQTSLLLTAGIQRRLWPAI